MTGLRVLAGSLLALLFTGIVAASEQCEDLDGLVEPSEVVEISSQVPGILEEVLLERGDKVEKDQVLARLKAGVEKAAVSWPRGMAPMKAEMSVLATLRPLGHRKGCCAAPCFAGHHSRSCDSTSLPSKRRTSTRS